MSQESLLAAENLRREWNARKDALGLTQEKAADTMGFKTQSAVSQYLLGQIALNTEAVLKFARLFDVDPVVIDPRISTLLPRTTRRVTTGDISAYEARANYRTAQPAPTIADLLSALASHISQAEPTIREEAVRLILRYLERPDERILGAIEHLLRIST